MLLAGSGYLFLILILYIYMDTVVQFIFFLFDYIFHALKGNN